MKGSFRLVISIHLKHESNISFILFCGNNLLKLALYCACLYLNVNFFFFPAFGNSQNSDEKSLQDIHTVAGLQDQAQLTLSKYIQATYPTQPFRFGKLLLSIPTLKTVCGNTIAELFFRKTIGNIPIERLLIDMFKSSDF